MRASTHVCAHAKKNIINPYIYIFIPTIFWETYNMTQLTLAQIVGYPDVRGLPCRLANQKSCQVNR
jgi:hypothetical protein